MKNQIIRDRIFAQAELCEGGIEIAGQKLMPDDFSAYVEFKLAHGFTRTNRVVTAYGTTFHPGTVANSFGSLHHKVLNYGHKIKSYNKRKQKDEPEENRRDFVLGTIVGVEFPNKPLSGWSVAMEGDPHIRAAAVIHKQLEKVPAVLGEHLGGRHTWTVSLEAEYYLLTSGFIVGDRTQAKKKVAELLDQTTPQEFSDLGLGYVTVEQALELGAEDLLDCYSLEKGAVVSAWQGLPVVLLKGGINGQVKFKGVGMVRFGAEKQAEIQQILATDPNALTDEEEAPDWEPLRHYFAGVVEQVRALTEE